jgi:uncharacterized protein (TIGR02118 family)
MKKGMIKVSVFYPNSDNTTFNMDYYLNKHIPMVAGLLGDAVKSATVEKGLVGGTPEAPAAYSAIGNLYFDSTEAFEKSFGANADVIMADIPNYTNSEPVLQISEVLI